MSVIDWSKAPEGATHCSPAFKEFRQLWAKQIDGVWHYHTGVGVWYYGAQPSKEEEYIPRPSPAWSGEGLPPVGTVCEVYHCDDWMTGEVIAHFQQKAGMVAAYTVEIGDGIKHLDCAIGECFRPIRTPEQIAADEREADIDRMISIYLEGAKDHRGGIRALYDAGLRFEEQKQ